jgi:Fe2+ transport system protein FeoA|tara:strand:+ start:3607 stop:4089 length:483 start_codon:yes stop_codon:yes gene_type:complete
MAVELKSQNKHANIQENDIEEFLEIIWTMREMGEKALDKILTLSEFPQKDTLLTELKDRNLISLDENKIILNFEGEKIAEGVIRRHRLPLTELSSGEKAKVVFITSKYHSRLDKLSALGCVPGSIIKLHQKSPSYVIKLGETDLALDKEICKEIFIKKIN